MNAIALLNKRRLEIAKESWCNRHNPEVLKRERTHKLIQCIKKMFKFVPKQYGNVVRFYAVKKPWLGVVANIPLELYDQEFLFNILEKQKFIVQPMSHFTRSEHLEGTLYIGLVPWEQASMVNEKERGVHHLNKQVVDPDYGDGWYWRYYELGYEEVNSIINTNSIQNLPIVETYIN